jgi:hypothetical protein
MLEAEAPEAEAVRVEAEAEAEALKIDRFRITAYGAIYISKEDQKLPKIAPIDRVIV